MLTLSHKMPFEFFGLSPERQISLAERYEAIAKELRDEAEKQQQKELSHKKIKRELKSLKTLNLKVLKHLRDGRTLDAAIKAVSERENSQVGTVKHYWKAFVQDNCKNAKDQRDKFLIFMCETGHTNKRIGKLLNMHPNSVSRRYSTLRKRQLNILQGELLDAVQIART